MFGEKKKAKLIIIFLAFFFFFLWALPIYYHFNFEEELEEFRDYIGFIRCNYTGYFACQLEKI